ncbi:MAG TPA: CPBP family glutamic-type intramembrane protease [Planctomycetota bacterium]|nr:CPBP family glutamic-type intramembrane protease [Planctomycetota bacterium]
MNPTPPGLLRAVIVLARFGIRRRVNQFRGNLGAAFGGRKKNSSGEPLRTGTARKGKAGGVLMGFVGIIFLFNGMHICSQFIRRVSERIDFQENMVVGQYAYDKLVEAAQMLQMADRLPQRSKEAVSSRKEWLDYLRHTFETDAAMRGLTKAEQQERAEIMMKVFKEKGVDGFRLKEVRPVIFFPSEQAWTLPENHEAMLRVAAGIWLLLSFALLFMIAGNMSQDLGKVEWGMEWLFTFPVPAKVIFLSRVFEYALVNAAVWFCALPYAFVLFWCCGYGANAFFLAPLAALYLALLLASVHVLAEVWLRKTFAPNVLKNLQAGFTLGGSVLFLVVIYVVSAPTAVAPVLQMAERLPLNAHWNPVSLPVLLCDSARAPWAAAGMLAAVIVLPLAAVRFCQYLVREGLTGTSGTYTGTREKARAAAQAPTRLRGIVGKELRLLFRDRNFLVQTLVVPVLGIGFQFLMSPELLAGAAGDLRHASTMAFGLGTYVLMFSAFQVLTVEGQGLWMLYTFPQDLSSILQRKTMLWCGFAMAYTLAVIGGCIAYNPALQWGAISPAVTALVGVVIYSYIASGIGVLGTDPLEPELQRKIRPEMMYLYMLLAAMFAYAIYTPSLWGKLAQLILSSLLAYALWQKVRDRAPFMLDPEQEPPPEISLADGMIAVLAFFVLQGLIYLVMIQTGLPAGAQMVIAFAGAGLLVALLSLYVFWRHKVPNFLASVGLRAHPGQKASYAGAVLWGVAAGLLAAAFASFYLWCCSWFEPLRVLRDETIEQAKLMKTDETLFWWIAGLAVIAAPLFEEFIFRGLVYRGLRRSVAPYVAVLASAGVFAIVHPPLSVIPVFVLGTVAGISFERTRLLLAPIVAHMVYNGIVVALQ